MKKKVISVVLLLALCLAIAIPAFAASATAIESYLADSADLLTPEEEYDLYVQLEQLSQEYNVHIFIATVNRMGTGDISSYIEVYYDQNQLGYGSTKDGILLLVSMNPRKVAILSNGTAHDAIGSSEIDEILDTITGDLSDGNYANAFHAFLEECDHYLDGHFNFQVVTNLLIALVIGLVVGLITAFILKAQLKSVRPQNQANAYVKPGSMQLTHRSDLFLYRRVTRTRKQSTNSSRSGSSRSGSSRSVGSRSF